MRDDGGDDDDRDDCGEDDDRDNDDKYCCAVGAGVHHQAAGSPRADAHHSGRHEGQVPGYAGRLPLPQPHRL